MFDRSRMARRAVAGGAAALLLLVVAEGWVPRLSPLGHERPTTDPHEQARKDGFDLDAAVERVTHEIAPLPGRTDSLATGNSRYSAEFDDGGFTYRPAGATTPFRLSLAAVTRSGEGPEIEPAVWTSRDNVATRQVAPAVDERVTARDGEVEWDVVLHDRPAGSGPLTVRGRLDGTTGATRVDGESGPAWRLDLHGGSSVDMDEMVVKDATGRTVYEALPRITAGHVELQVPAPVLDQAAYPLIIDPTVGSKVEVTPGGRGGKPAVAFGGGIYLVVYENVGAVGNIDVRARRLDANGVLQNDILSPGGSTKNETAPDVAWNGSTFLVVWTLQYSSNDPDVQARTVSPGGALGTVQSVSSRVTVEDAASVSASGSTFFVAWQDGRNASLDVFGARVDSGGVVFQSSIPVATSAKPDYLPDVAGSNNGWLVAYQFDFEPNDPDVLARRVDGAGVPQGAASGIEVHTGLDRQRSPSVASDGSQWLIAFEDETTTGSGVFDISGVRVNSAGVISQFNFPIVSFSADQLQPSVAFRGVFLVTWWDKRDGPDFSDVFAGRVEGDGDLLDGSGFSVARTNSQEDFPAVTAGSGAENHNWAVVDEFGTMPTLEFRSVSK